MHITCEDVGSWVAAGDATLGRDGDTFGRLQCALGGGQLGSPAPHQMHQASTKLCPFASQLQPHGATAAASTVHARSVYICTKGDMCIVVLQAAGSHGTQCYQAPKHKRGISASEALSWQQRLGFTCQIAGQRGQLGTQRWVLQQQHVIHGDVHTQRLILQPWV